MPRDRFFVPGARIAGEHVALGSDDARKLVTVLRRTSGANVQIVDGEGTAFSAKLAIDGKTVYAELEAPLAQTGRESASRIVLAQALPKGQKMDLVVEKATELGVWSIVPLRSNRVEGSRAGGEKRERWQRIAKSAAAQAGRTRIPVVEEPAGWPELEGIFGDFDRIYLAWEGCAVRPLRETFEPAPEGANGTLIVVGPEGGFDAAEVASAQAAGAIPVSLGPRTLRTETAALVLISCLLYARGEI